MTTEPLERHELTLASSDCASGKASEWARALAERAGLAERRAHALDLCVVELVTNVVNHGYAGAPGPIRLELHLGRAAAILAVADEAPEFNPLAFPAPAVPASLDEAVIGGYGIHMVRSAADGCRYERRGGRNVFTAYFGVS